MIKQVKLVCGDDLTPKQLRQVMKPFNNRTFHLAMFCDDDRWPDVLDLQQPNYLAVATDHYEDEHTRIYSIHHKDVFPDF